MAAEDELNLPEVFDPAHEAHRRRLSGQAWAEIAACTGYASARVARMAVTQYLTRAAAQVDQAQKAEALQLELDRLDALQESFWGTALQGDDKAATTVLNIMRHRSKLLGLETADTQENQVQTIVIAGTPEEYVAGLRRVAEAQAASAPAVEA